MTKEQWLAIKNNDARYDGVFFYGVKTTGTVCRPSCTARSCKAKNVIIFDTLQDALGNGFRPCLRCRPDVINWRGAKNELAEKAKHLIEEQYLEKFSVDKLADQMHINKSYLMRAFKETTGHTMLWYHNQVRCKIACELLTHAELSITQIAQQIGYDSSHFSRVFQKMYGVTPTVYRKNFFDDLENS